MPEFPAAGSPHPVLSTFSSLLGLVMPHLSDETLTLDPPGSIAVIGAGPLGIEAALYGRFLGYHVTLLEADQVAASLRDQREQPLPMMPDRCLSPLANSALDAQFPDSTPRTLPTTVGAWIDQALVPLTETDLLRSRVRVPAKVVSIETYEVEPEASVGEQAATSDESSEEVPPDFRVHFLTEGGQGESIDVEAVIVATRAADQIKLSFDTPAAYFFCIGSDDSGDAEGDLHGGWRDIVAVFAQLVGRGELDLYRPRRL